MSSDQPVTPTQPDIPLSDPIDRVIRYHVRTKHHFHRYARSLGFLDWANQPDPFRRFDGAPLVPLPLLGCEDEPRSPAYDAIYRRNGVTSQPVTRASLSRFLELALALSAWKRAGDTQWALRSNPSSGNLHPTEGYILLPAIETLGLAPGLYHYAAKEHALEQRAAFAANQVGRLLCPFPPAAFLLGFSSVHWRESWKYGERAFRYCNHDVGHAIGTARIAAATLGWKMILLEGMALATVGSLLGTDRACDYEAAEPEHPDTLAVVWPSTDPQTSSGQSVDVASIPLFLEAGIIKELSAGPWNGRANRLSREKPVPWEVIDDVAEASSKMTTQYHSLALPLRDHEFYAAAVNGSDGPNSGPLAGDIIRRRRSAVAFDGKTVLSADTFYRMLRRVMPGAGRPYLERPMPWDTLPWAPTIHLLLFVHRIDDLSPGLYVLARDRRKVGLLQKSLNPELEWTPAPGSSDDVPLYWLLEGDATKLAAQVSCHQDIAGDSAFSLGMLAEFEGLLRSNGAWWYPRLFWEAGLVGQVLYLEAEAAEVRGTGIGCFFDDPVHEIVGIEGLSLQSLYHFTIGGPVEDPRLQTLAPYYHLPARFHKD